MNLQIEFSGFQQRLLLNEQPFDLKIYEGPLCSAEGFNTVLIGLDATEDSLLNWKEALVKAEDAVKQGFMILWELKLGLLEGSLDDEARYLALGLGIEHFVQHVWPHFSQSTCGVALFRGALNLSMRDTVVEYLLSLAAQLPEQISCFLFLDTSQVCSAAEYFQLVNQDAFKHFQLIVKGRFSEKYPYAIPQYGWGHAQSPLGMCSSSCEPMLASKPLTCALLLHDQFDLAEMNHVIQQFNETPFRVISENLLTDEWEGIDHLIALKNSVSHKLQRKLLGFEAAGGAVISYPDDAASLQLL